MSDNDNFEWRIEPPDDGSNRPARFDPQGTDIVPFTEVNARRTSLLGKSFRAAHDTVRGYGYHLRNRPFPTLGTTGLLGVLGAMVNFVAPTAIETIRSPYARMEGRVMLSALTVGVGLGAYAYLHRYWQTGSHLRHNSFMNAATGQSGEQEYEYGHLEHGEEGLTVRSALNTFGGSYTYSRSELIKYLKFDGEEYIRKAVKPFKKSELLKYAACVSAYNNYDEFVRERFAHALKPESIDAVMKHLQDKFLENAPQAQAALGHQGKPPEDFSDPSHS